VPELGDMIRSLAADAAFRGDEHRMDLMMRAAKRSSFLDFES